MLAGTGGFGGGRLGAPRTNIGSGKGKEPMPVDEDDRRLDNDDLMANESVLDNLNPSKRRRMPEDPGMTMTYPQEDLEMGINIIDSSAPRTGRRRQTRKKPQEHWTRAKPYYRKL